MAQGLTLAHRRVDPDHPVAHGALTATLLAAEGAALGLFLQSARLRGLSDAVLHNEMSAGDRVRLLRWTFAGTATPLLIFGIVLLIYRQRAFAASRRVADILSPLLVALAVPALFVYKPWHAEPLPFLVLLAAAVVATEHLARRSLAAIPPWLTDALRPARPVPAAVSRWAPLAAVVLAALGYTLFTAYFTILAHHKLRTASFDLGIYDNLMYNALHGAPFRSPVLFGPDGGNYLAGHAEFAMLLFTPIYALHPGAETLLVLQSVLLGFAAVPLYLFAATQVPRPTAALMAIAYLLFAPMHGPHFYDFHWLPLAIFFHYWLYYGIAARRWWLVGVVVPILLAIREDVGVGLAVLGVFLLLTGARPKFGAALAVVSAAWFAFLRFYLMPAAGDFWFSDLYKDLVAPGFEGYGGVVRTLLTNPAYVLTTLLHKGKLVYVLHMLVPVAFLPLRRPALLLLLIPGAFFTILTTGYEPTISIAFQYTAHWIPYLFAASVLGLRSLSQISVTHRRAALGALGLGIASHSYVFGAVLQHHTFEGGFAKIQFSYSQEERQQYADLRRLLALIPPKASVAATDSLVPHVSARSLIFALRGQHGDAQYLLIDRRQLTFCDTTKTLDAAFARNKYGLVETAGKNFFLFEKGVESPGTAAAMRELGIGQAKRQQP